MSSDVFAGRVNGEIDPKIAIELDGPKYLAQYKDTFTNTHFIMPFFSTSLT